MITIQGGNCKQSPAWLNRLRTRFKAQSIWTHPLREWIMLISTRQFIKSHRYQGILTMLLPSRAPPITKEAVLYLHRRWERSEKLISTLKLAVLFQICPIVQIWNCQRYRTKLETILYQIWKCWGWLIRHQNNLIYWNRKITKSPSWTNRDALRVTMLQT